MGKSTLDSVAGLNEREHHSSYGFTIMCKEYTLVVDIVVVVIATKQIKEMMMLQRVSAT